MPRARPLDAEASFSEAEFGNIARGVEPSGQDDRWSVRMDDDHTLHVYRSWTGHEIYRVRFERSGSDWRVTEASVNDDPDQYEPSSWDARTLESMLRHLAAGGRL